MRTVTVDVDPTYLLELGSKAYRGLVDENVGPKDRRDAAVWLRGMEAETKGLDRYVTEARRSVR